MITITCCYLAIKEKDGGWIIAAFFGSVFDSILLEAIIYGPLE